MPTDHTNGEFEPFVLVLGLDLTDTESSGYALDQAARIVKRIPGSEMHLIHVAPASTTADKARQAAQLLQLYVSEKASELGLATQSVGIHVRTGEPGPEIAQIAADVNADLIVVGTHHRPNLKELFLGSTAEHVMATARCPVFVAGPRPHPKPSHIVVIEPPCPDCLAAREASAGRTWWCARHSEHHRLRRHHYSYQSELPFESHDSAVTPTGL
jgi:nucleotide-binding universal stress UspA family protein